MKDGRLAENIIQFGRALRRAGLPVGPASIVEAVKAVEIAGSMRRSDFYWTLHAIFVSRHDHHPIFDQAFMLFWQDRDLPRVDGTDADSDAAEDDEPPPAARRVAEAMQENLADATAERREIEIDARLSVAEAEALRRRDFAQMDAREIAEAERMIERLRLPNDRVVSRRMASTPSGKIIDARRTLRASLRAGGDLILLRHREPRLVHPPIVVLCDISGSMSPYTRVLLHFFHVLSRQRRVTTFLFGTRLTNVTRQLRYRDPDEALAACSKSVMDWSGGTRITEALHLFNRDWSRRVLGQGAIVLLITDGLERGDTDELAREMDRLHRSCRRLVWLNPLLGYEGFEAKARGIRAMLPHVDELRSVHSLEAVSDICRALSGESGPAFDPRAWLDAA